MIRARACTAPVDRGKYPHPEYYGMPAEMGMDSHPEREIPASPGAPGALQRNEIQGSQVRGCGEGPELCEP